SYDGSGNLVSLAPADVLAPQIIGQPVAQVAALRQIATFSVLVADANVTFQWKFNGANIDGATGDSLLLTAVSAANVGQYTVVVPNSAGSVTSVPATLTLETSPAAKQ